MKRNDSSPIVDESAPDPDGDTLTCDWTDRGAPSRAVIDAVAAATGSAPERLQPLYAAIDPDALDRLFERYQNGTETDPALSIAFEYEECQVRVLGSGRVSVSVPAHRSS